MDNSAKKVAHPPPSVRLAAAWMPGLLILGALTFLPALRSPLMFDDYLHVAMIDGTYPAKRSPFDLFNFVTDADREVLRERGVIPWWSSDKLTIRFCRPLSSALMWADHKAFANRPVWLHLHGLAWWALGVMAVQRLLRRLFSERVAMMGVAIFALGQWHATPLAWLANREALISLALGALALNAYWPWREHRRARDGVLAAALFSLALLSGEYALSFGGYVLALEIATRRQRVMQRVAGLAPFVLPAVTYMTVRALLGYGTRGSSFYSDPFHAPVAFLRAAPGRVLTLLVDGWLGVDAHGWSPSFPQWTLVAVAGALIAVAFVPLTRTVNALDDERRKSAVALLLGSVLALAPVLAVAPTPRLLGASAIGVSATLALVLEHTWFPGRERPKDRGQALMGAVAIAIGFVHFIYGPVNAWLTCEQLRATSTAFAGEALRLGKTIDNFATADVTVIRGLGGMFFGPFSLDARGTPVAHWRILSQTGHVLVLRRDARTIEVVVPKGRSLFPTGDGNLFRSDDEALKPGDVLVAQGVRATIVEVGSSGGPTDVKFEFGKDLDERGTRFLSERFDGFRDVTLPAPGFGMPLEPWVME